MYKDPENIEDLKETLNAENPKEKDWDYSKSYYKQRKRNTHLIPKKRNRKK